MFIDKDWPIMKTIAASILALVFGCPTASAHHSRESLYDTSMTREIEGEIIMKLIKCALCDRHHVCWRRHGRSGAV